MLATRALPATSAPPAGTLSDEAHLLRGGERTALERLLRAKSTQSGSPLSIVLVPHLAHDEAIDALARRTFAAKSLDAPGPPQVLLAVAKHERRAAIETGQGPAGIVPEIDARRIIRRLEESLGRHRLAGGLEEAVSAIGASARATADRRRPLPPDPLDAPPAQTGVPDVMEPGPPADAGVQTKPDGGAAGAPQPVEPAPPGRSLYPKAALLAAAVVIGLALRRRRRFVQEHPAPDRRKPPPGGPANGL